MCVCKPGYIGNGEFCQILGKKTCITVTLRNSVIQRWYGYNVQMITHAILPANNTATIQVWRVIIVHVIMAITLLLMVFLVWVSMHVHEFHLFVLQCPNNNYTDINECHIPNFNGCIHAQCNNTEGSFVCICDPGFVSDDENNCIGKINK